MTAKLSKTATAVLSRMRERPDAEFFPIGQRNIKDAERLVMFGLAERVTDGRQSDYWGFPLPVYRLTEAGRGS